LNLIRRYFSACKPLASEFCEEVFVMSVGGRLEEMNLITHSKDTNKVTSLKPEGEAERKRTLE
jgi:hypothetical protein